MVISYLHEGQCPEYQEDGTMAVSGRYGKLPMPDKGETIFFVLEQCGKIVVFPPFIQRKCDIFIDYLSSDVRVQLPVQQMMEVTRVNTWTPVMGSW